MAIRLGTEDKKKRLMAMIAVPLALTALAYIVWELVGGPSYTPPPATPVASVYQPAAAASQSSNRAAQHVESATSLDPTLHPEWMAKAENTVYSGTSRNIFSKDSLPPMQQAAIEKPVASARTGPVIPSGPPPPPPIDLKFYGFAKQQNGRKLVFLMHGEDIFIAGVGDIVNGRYKVIQVNSNSVVIEDLAYTNQQTLPLLVS